MGRRRTNVGMAADHDRELRTRGRLEGVVAHGKGRDLEPVRPEDARVAEPECVGSGEPAVPGDVLLNSVRAVGAAVADAEPDERTAWRQVAAEELSDDADRAAPGHLAGPDADQPDPRRHDDPDLGG